MNATTTPPNRQAGLLQEVVERFSEQSRERGQFDDINSSFPGLAFRDERLGSLEFPSHLHLLQPGVEPCPLQPLEEPAILRTPGSSHLPR